MSGQGSDARRRLRLQYIAFAVLVVVGVAIGVSLAIAHPAKHPHHHHNVLLAVVITAVVVLLAAAFGVFLLRRLNRQPALQRLLGIDPAQRRATSRAIQKQQPLTGEQHGIAEAQLANLVSSRRRMRWLLPASIVSLLIAAIVGHGGLRVLLLVLVALEVVCAVALLVLQRVMQGRYQRALARPSDQD